MADHTNSEMKYDLSAKGTVKIMEEMQKQIQLLQFRVDQLERHLGAATSMGIPLTAAAAPTLFPPGQLPPAQNYYYNWQQQQQQQQQGIPGRGGPTTTTTSSSSSSAIPAGTSWSDPVLHEGLHTSKQQLEEELHRLGISASSYAVPPPQQQRDDAIMAMLSGSPTSRTPTAMGVMGFPPTQCAELQTLQTHFPVHMHPNASANPAAAGMMAGGNIGQVPILPSNAGGAGSYGNMFPRAPTQASAAIAAGGTGVGGPAVAMGGNMASHTAITIDPARSSNEALERACQQHQYLKELCLKGCKNITDYSPLMRLRNLWKLNLQGCSLHVDDNVVKIIAAHSRRLSRLNLCGCERITDASPLAQLAFLFDLNLSGTQITTASLEAISVGCSQLSRLAINSCPQVTSVSCVGNLKELKLLYCRYSGNISPASISDVLVAIGRNLLTLNVDGIKFSELNLSQLPPVTALKNLNIKDNTEVACLRWLTDMPHAATVFGALEMLDVEGCLSLSSVGHVAALPLLKTLRLSHTAISNQELVEVAASTSIAVLHLEGCANISSVAALSGMRSLTKLVLDLQMQHTNPVDNGIVALTTRSVGGAKVEIVFAAPASAGASASGSPTGHGQSHLGSHPLASHPSPFTTPTAYVVPPLPGAVHLGVIGDHMNGMRI